MNAAINLRTSDRIYLPETIKILINDQRFILNNISGEGIGILIEDPFDFSLGQRIASIILENREDAQSLTGIVNHISHNKFGIICGIRFVFRNNAEFDYLEKFNQQFSMK